MSKQVQQFITRVNEQIKNGGLLQMSGARFDRGDTPMTFLKQKAGITPFMNGTSKKVSVAEIAEEANALMDDIAGREGKALFRKRKNNGMVPKSVGVWKDYTDEVL